MEEEEGYDYSAQHVMLRSCILLFKRDVINRTILNNIGFQLTQIFGQPLPKPGLLVPHASNWEQIAQTVWEQKHCIGDWSGTIELLKVRVTHPM